MHGYMEACLRKPILIMGWGYAERAGWDTSRALAHCHISPGYLDASTGERRWFCSSGGAILPDHFYDGLVMSGFVDGDDQPGKEPYFQNVCYKDVHRVQARDAERMHKTLKRLERREEQWRGKQLNTDDRYGKRADIRAFYHALNAQQVWICEGSEPKDGRFLNLEDAIKWLFKKGDDLALQCRIITGKHNGEIIAYTSAPEDFDGFSARTVEWLPYTDNAGRRYREISLQGRDWQWQLGRNFSGLFGLLQAHEFEALKPLLKPWEEETIPDAAATVE